MAKKKIYIKKEYLDKLLKDIEIGGTCTYSEEIIAKDLEEDVDDGYRTEIVERKEFSDMGELRSYLITEYKMPFEMASKDINDTYWNDMNFNVEQT